MANEVAVKLSRSVNIGGVTIGGVDETVLCDYQQVFKQTVGAGVLNYRVDIPITVENVRVSGIHSNQDNVTIYTNYPSTATNPGPTQTITLTKNVAQIYSINEPAAVVTFTDDLDK